jgi:hypothetical protein
MFGKSNKKESKKEIKLIHHYKEVPTQNINPFVHSIFAKHRKQKK